MNDHDPAKPPEDRELFVAALKLPAGPGREAWLAQACGQDRERLARVQSLLDHHRDDDFLAQPAVAIHPTSTVTSIAEKPGDRIGHYKLIEKIGEGGCGVVYMAEQEEPVRRRVALKVIKPGMDTRSVIARFEAERQALAVMDHPNIAKIFDAGVTGESEISNLKSEIHRGRPYFVMELVRGVRIIEYCDENTLSAPDRLALFVKVCQAIQHAHQKGIIHRDIKPSNILVTVNDGEAVPKVIDFGIAKATEQKLTDKTFHTLFAEFLGTPAYMSPEQAAMTSLDVDTRSDIYSLGVLLYELLTGKTPFDAKELVAAGFDGMRRTIRERDPARPSTRLRTLTAGEQTTTAQRRGTAPPKLIHLLSGDLDWVVMKCLEKDRSRRYDTASGLAADIQRHLDSQPVLARPPSHLYQVQKFLGRHRGVVLGLAAVMVCLGLGAALSTWFFLGGRAARQISELRNAELATRSGGWRDALKHWDAAERAGYQDRIDLGLKRAEAWVVLQNRAKARTEFDKLLLPYQAEAVRHNGVLLRAGEFEMFDRDTLPQGIQRIREALTNGLSAADEWLAKGLLADSTPDALAAFRRALEIDPYLHSAHRHSLGLEFALGRHDELASHLRVASVLYPGDFSHGVLQASEHALLGRTAEAQAVLDTLRTSMPSESYKRMEKAARFFGKAAEYFEVENYLGERGTNAISKAELIGEATQIFLAGNLGDVTNAARGRLPSLPCVEQGIRAGFEGLQSLALARVFGGASRTEAALEKVREGCRHHPEALFPTFAGVFLDNQQPRSGPRDLRLLAFQSEMYQLGSDSPSILPKLGRLARLLAVDVQQELALSEHTNAAAFRINCVANLRLAALDPLLTPIECLGYSRCSNRLGEYDINRQFLAHWETLRPGDTNLLRHRIRLELASGAYGPALKHIDRALAANPDDKFAKTERDKALQEIKKLNDAAHPPTTNNR